ncbi:MAG: EAL domain-containing protein [Lachnospiraceae bacterium]|nr:EAL domain-containing protein [Lachnospiraceae bacterium]
MPDRRKVLLVDDTRVNRMMLSDMLSKDYDILEAGDGEAAIMQLEDHHDEIAIVLLDIVMPKKDGFEVLNEMNLRDWISKIPVIMITAEFSDEFITKASRLGAIDYITKPFNFTIVQFRVASTIELYAKQRKLLRRLTEMSDRENGINSLTGLPMKEAFFDRARQFLHLHEEPCVLMAVDIEHFKLLNDTYGRVKGDAVLKEIAEQLRVFVNKEDVLAGYLGGDDFAVMLPNDKELIDSIVRRLVNRVKNMRIGTGILPAVGVYVIGSDETDMIENMYDRACIAAGHCLGDYRERMCEYDRTMMDEMVEENDRLGRALEGLRNGEFTFYLQPQCDIKTGKIVGAEALARWVHDGKLIPPYQFVPVMEKNDVISDLDFHIWEGVCKWLRKWIDEGHTPVPISINVSRLDIYTFDLPAIIKELITTYDLDPKLLKVEITESSYIEELKAVNNAVDTLQDLGFRIFMDDFGSGYSSLNMLTNVNIDVLKIDMMFLDFEEGNRKGLDILESVVNMAKLLHLPVVVEGVETEQQLEFLKKLNCDYAQGYYFYKPMPIEEFEALISKKGMLEPNANFAKFEVEVDDALDVSVTHKELQDAMIGAYAAVFLLDAKSDYALPLRSTDRIRELTNNAVIPWGEGLASVFKEVVAKEDKDDVIPFISRQYVMHSFHTMHEFRQILYHDDAGSDMILQLRPLRMENGTVTIALLTMVDVTDIHNAFLRKEKNFKEFSNTK